MLRAALTNGDVGGMTVAVRLWMTHVAYFLQRWRNLVGVKSFVVDQPV